LTPKEVITLATKKQIYDDNLARIEQQEKLYHYYQGNKNELESYLIDALSITYDIDDISEMQLNYVNIVKKLVNQIAVIYKKQPDRYLANEDGERNEDWTNYYLEMLPDDIENKDKTANRYGLLFDTVLTQVYFDNGIKYRVHPSQNINVKVDDEDTQKIKILMYDKYFNDELYTIVFTDTEHYKLDQDGNPVSFKGNENNKNSFGVIPFARWITGQFENLWGEGMTDAVNVNEQINFLLTKLVNRDIVLGTEGVTLAVNCGLKKKVIEEDGTTTSTLRKVRVGRKHPIVVENLKSDDQPARVEHIAFTSHIQEIKDTIDWYIKLIALTKGLNPNSFLAETQATSGYSKIIDSMEQLEFREDMLASARLYEQERFEITRKVNNYYAGTKEGTAAKLKAIPDNLELVVDFAEIEIPRTSQEIRDDRQFEFDKDLSTPKDWLKKNNPDLTDEEAEEKLIENKKFNDSLRKQTTLFESLINKNNGVKNDVNQ
jgi:tRNA uridine 5-carbamoylmethylation protein Kti12